MSFYPIPNEFVFDMLVIVFKWYMLKMQLQLTLLNLYIYNGNA